MSLDEIRQVLSSDNSLQLVLQLLRDQVKPPHSGLHQYSMDVYVLVSQ